MPRGRPPPPRRLRNQELHSLDIILLRVLKHVQHVRRVRDEDLHLNGGIREQPAVPAHDGAQVGRQQLQLAIGSELAEDAVPDAIRRNQRKSEEIRGNQRQSDEIVFNHIQSDAIRRNQTQSDAIGRGCRT